MRIFLTRLFIKLAQWFIYLNDKCPARCYYNGYQRGCSQCNPDKKLFVIKK